MHSKILKLMVVSFLSMSALVCAESLHQVTYDKSVVYVYKSTDPNTSITEFSEKDTLIVVPANENYAFKTCYFQAEDADVKFSENSEKIFSYFGMDYVYTNVTTNFKITATTAAAFAVQDTVYSKFEDESLCFVSISNKLVIPGDSVLLTVSCGSYQTFKQVSCVNADGEEIKMTEPEIYDNAVYSKFKMPESNVYCSALGELQSFEIKHIVESGNGTVSNKQKTVQVGKKIQFTMVPDEHYRSSGSPRLCYTPENGKEENCRIIPYDEEEDLYYFAMPPYDVTIKYGFDRLYDVSTAEIDKDEEYEKGRCYISNYQERLEKDTIKFHGTTLFGMSFDELKCVDEKNKNIEFLKKEVDNETKEGCSSYDYVFLMPASNVSCECFASMLGATFSYEDGDHIKYIDMPDSADYRDTVKFQVKVDKNYTLGYVGYSPDENTKKNIACSENKKNKNTYDCSFVLEDLGEMNFYYNVKEKIKDAIVQVYSSPTFNIMITRKTLSVSGVKVGSEIVVLDMQGKIIVSKSAATTMADVQVSRAGRYMVKVGDYVEVVTVK